MHWNGEYLLFIECFLLYFFVRWVATTMRQFVSYSSSFRYLFLDFVLKISHKLFILQS